MSNRLQNKIALVNVDCDLYESAVPVFRFIEPLLQEGAVLASGFETERLELGGHEERGDVLVARGRAAAVQFVVGQEVHIRANFTFKRCRLHGCCVE